MLAVLFKWRRISNGNATVIVVTMADFCDEFIFVSAHGIVMK